MPRYVPEDSFQIGVELETAVGGDGAGRSDGLDPVVATCTS